MRISDWSSDVCSSDLRPATTFRSRVRSCCSSSRNWEIISQLSASLQTPRNATTLSKKLSLGCATSIPTRIAIVQRKPLVSLDCGSRPALQNQTRSEEHPSELHSLMRLSYAVFCLKT